MHVERHGVGEFEETLLDACLHDLVLDRQADERRAPWLARIVSAGGAADRVCARVVATMDAKSGYDDDIEQACELLLELARGGSAPARDAIRRAVDRWGRSHWAGTSELVQLEGIEGLLHVARVCGAAPEGTDRDEDWLPGSIVEEAEHRLGVEAVGPALRQAAASDAAVRAFVERIGTADRSHVSPRPAPGPHLATYAAFLASGSTMADWDFARHAPDDEVRRAFVAMLDATDAADVRRHLAIFTRRALPAFDERVLEWAQHADDRIRRMSRHALGRLRDPAVRATAMRLFVDPPRNEDRTGLLAMLASSYRSGDHAAIGASLGGPADRLVTHALVGDVADLAAAQDDPALAGCLLWAYEKSDCGVSRRGVVRELRRRGASPAWVEEEIRFDANESVRGIADPAARQGDVAG